jgi:predicted MFS family arabinose efflux permease
LRNRWFALAVLFIIRLTMAFQFQSVAAVAPLLGDTFGVSLADIGWLIGLYFAPGIALAFPGGAIGKRFGDKPTVIASLVLMLAGELAMTLSPSWPVQIAGRLVSGAGGVMFNVQMTKMVADWFAGREIATAMAIFVNSWPAGIALSLVSLPPIATAFGIEAVYLTVAASIALGLVFFAAAYPSPPKVTTTTATGSAWPDRTTFAVLMIILPRSEMVISTVTAIGLLSGLPVGPMMSLPARVLKAETRAIGMGIFYTLYYATMMLGPVVAGAVAKSTGQAAAAIDFGAIVLLACPILLWAFNRLPQARPKVA